MKKRKPLSKKYRMANGRRVKKWWKNPTNREKQSLAHLGNPGYWKGKEIPDYAKEKMRLAKIGKYDGKNHPQWKGGKTRCIDCNQLLGDYDTPRCRECYELYNRGENHYNWQGGKSFEPYSTDWTITLKRSIRERDNYICQLCSQYGNTVHHKDYDKKNCSPSNLLTLCRKCNSMVNFNRNYWIKYFQIYDTKRI